MDFNLLRYLLLIITYFDVQTPCTNFYFNKISVSNNRVSSILYGVRCRVVSEKFLKLGETRVNYFNDYTCFFSFLSK